MPLNPISGSVGVSIWKTEVMQLAQSIDPALNLLIANDFETDTAASASTTLSGTVTYDTGVTGGVARVKTGATPFAQAIIYNAGGSALVGNPRDESWYVHSRCWIKNIPTGDSGLSCIGLQDVTGLSPQFITFGWLADYDANYFILQMNKQDGSIDVRYSSVAPDTAGPHDVGIGRDIVNDKIYAIVDGVPILEEDGPFDHLTSQPCFEFAGFIGQNLFGQDSELWVDNIAIVVKQP